MQNEKYFRSRAEQYAQNPTLRNRSLLLAQQIDELKQQPEYKEFREHLHRAIIEVREAGRLDKRAKRARVIQALKNYICEFDELADETRLARKDIQKVLKVLIRARLVKIKKRMLYLDPQSPKNFVFIWHDLKDL